MEPEFHHGDKVLVSGLFYVFVKPKENDVVIAYVLDRFIIKRIAKKVGDQYFLSGDNKKESIDSRRFGLISKKAIVGKVLRKLS